MPTPFGNALIRTLVPPAPAIAKALAPKAEPLPTMADHADAMHPVPAAIPAAVTMTPNRMTGRFAK